MESSPREMFAFKRALYNISNLLADSDLGKMKFMLSDYLPRLQLEKSCSGFDLLCLMATKSSLLSCGDYSFLEELLKEVGKGDVARSMFLASYSSDTQLDTSVAGSCTSLQKMKLKRFLSELSDDLTAENVHDLCLFFAGICKSINYQNLYRIKSGEQFFSKLLENEMIGVGHLQPVKLVFEIIGRLDLVTIINTWLAAQQDSADEHYGAMGRFWWTEY